MPNVLVNDDSLKAIGNAIRGKNGETTTYKPAEMAAAITAISGGGSSGYVPTDEELTFSDNCAYLDYQGKIDWVIKNYGDRINILSVTDCSNMFTKSKLEEIPFDINLGVMTSGLDFSKIFNECFYLKKLPKFIPPTTGYYRTGNLAFAFSSLRSLTSFPENYFSFLAPINNPSYSAKDCSYMLSFCYKLKSLPNDFNTKIIDQYGGSYYYSVPNKQPLYGAFSSLMSLIEIRNLHIPPITGNIDSNLFQKTFSNCMSLKHLTFLPDYILTWKSQVIDLSSNVGYGTGKATVENYNTLQILDKLKEVKDDATYQALKNTDDWWSQDIAYSCYNKASAVETINSLPDTSAYLATAGGTNTIKFKGEAGSATDGGAINTMTEEEIAVATAKGWTVSFA